MEEITQTLDLLRLWGKNLNWYRINMESSYLYGFIGIGGPWVKFIRFSPRVLWYEVPNHQYKCYGMVLNEFHVDS